MTFNVMRNQKKKQEYYVKLKIASNLNKNDGKKL